MSGYLHSELRKTTGNENPKLYGGGCSLSQTVLRQIPCKQGKNREFVPQNEVNGTQTPVGVSVAGKSRVSEPKQNRDLTGNDLGMEFPCYEVLRENVAFASFQR